MATLQLVYAHRVSVLQSTYVYCLTWKYFEYLVNALEVKWSSMDPTEYIYIYILLNWFQYIVCYQTCNRLYLAILRSFFHYFTIHNFLLNCLSDTGTGRLLCFPAQTSSRVCHTARLYASLLQAVPGLFLITFSHLQRCFLGCYIW